MTSRTAMAGFFGYVGSASHAAGLDLRAVSRTLLRSGGRVRTVEEWDSDGRFATVLIERKEDLAERSVTANDVRPASVLAPTLLFDGPAREVLEARLETVRDVEAFVKRELETTSIGGGFAFAIWGRRHHTLAIGCDPIGLRPVYFTGSSDWFAFSTDVTAILESDLVRRRMSPAVLRAFLRDGGAPDACLVEGVRRLRPGSFIVVRPFSSSKGSLPHLVPSDDLDERLLSCESLGVQFTKGEPVVLAPGSGSGMCSELVDAARRAGAASVIRLTFDPAEHGMVEESGIVRRRVDVERHDPSDVLDGVASWWDDPMGDGVRAWLCAAEARRLGARALVSDMAPAGPAQASGARVFDWAQKRAESARLFQDREIDRLLTASSAGVDSPHVAPPPRHRLELASLSRMALAHSLECSVPFLSSQSQAVEGTARTIPVDGALSRMLRSWILDHYFEQGLDALRALAESGTCGSETLQGLWNRFRFDVDPGTTAQVWALVVLGSWIRRNEICGVA